MHTQLVSWSRLVFLGGLVLCLILVIPVASFPFQLVKVAAFSVALAACAILFVAGGGARELLRAHGFLPALAVLGLPLGYLLSWAFSLDRTVGLLGYGVETDTVLFTGLAAGAFVLSFALFRTLRTVRVLLTVLFWSLAAAAIFQLISLLFGQTLLPFETFADRSTNLVGKWNDLGFLAALLGLMLFARAELGSGDHLSKVAAAVGGAFLVVLLGLVNFAPAWALFLVGCVAIAIFSLVRKQSGEAATPWYSSAGIAVAILFLLYGSALNSSLTSVFPVSSLEVRPSFTSTLDLMNAERADSLPRAFVGTGPNTFGQRWLLHKPAEVNQTPFWNLDFNVGYSTVSTALLSAGLIGALVWLLPLFLVLAAILRVVRLGTLGREERVSAFMLGIASLFLYASLIFYVPSQNLILLAFVLAGATFGFLWRQGRSAQEADEGAPRYAVLVFCAALVALTLLGAGLTARRFVAQTYTGSGLYALSQGDSQKGLERANAALVIERAPDALRLRAAAGARRLAEIARDSSLPQTQARDLFSAEAEQTISAGQALVAAVPADYRSYFSLGQIYQLFASLKVEGAHQAALTAYAEATKRNPMSPAIALERARLEAAEGDAEEAKEALTQALTLKPDYTDAILLLVEINVAQNDLAAAIANTEAAVRSAPGVAAIWFQLGVLYQAKGDESRSAQALEQALVLAPDYANAKYYLGVVYAALGRSTEALELFEDLAAKNPDNESVSKIVQNLRAGRPALEGVGSTGEGAPVAE